MTSHQILGLFRSECLYPNWDPESNIHLLPSSPQYHPPNPSGERHYTDACKPWRGRYTQHQPQRQQSLGNCVGSRQPVHASTSAFQAFLTPQKNKTHSTTTLTPPSPLLHHLPVLLPTIPNSSTSPNHPFFRKYLPNFSTPSAIHFPSLTNGGIH